MIAKFIQDDIPTILSSKVFGEDEQVLWGTRSIPDVIFDDEDVEVSLGEGPTEIVSQPMLTAATSQFKGIKENDEVTVRGEKMWVMNWKKDGTGIIEIFLTRNEPC